MIYLSVAAFIAMLIVGFRAARKSGRLKEFCFIAVLLAIIGFSVPVLVTWQSGNSSNRFELELALAALLMLLPITWKVFSLLQKSHSERDNDL